MENTTQSRLDRFSWFMTQNRLTVLIVSIIVSIILGYGVFRMVGEVRLYELFPYDHPYLRLQQKFFEVFGSGGSGVVIALKAKEGDIFNENVLTKMQKMNNEVEMWDEVYRTLTISIANRAVKVVKAKSKGEISIEPLMWPEIPQNEKQMDQLKRYIFSNPAYNGTLVSRDGTATLLITEFKDTVSYDQAFEMLRNLEAKYTDDTTSVHIVGFPIMMGWIYSYKTQILFVSAVSVGLMFLILVIIFRNFGGIMAPTIFGIMCTALGLGFIGWTGINFSPLLYVLAFLVGARMVSHSVQITHRYFEEYADPAKDRVQACYETMRKMLVPNWAGVVTDAAGFLVLMTAKILLMQMVAVFMTFWMTCIGLCGILTPILCSYLPIGRATEQYAREREELSWLDRICISLANFSISGGGRYVVGGLCLALLAFCTWQAGNLKIGDPSPGTALLWPDHKFNQDTAVVDQTFSASSENFLLFYEGKEGSVYDPVVFTTFEAFDRHMKRELPDIYKASSSLTDMVKMLNETLRDGDKIWAQMPRNTFVLTGLLGYTRDNVDRGTLNRFMDGTMQRSQITVFFADHTSDNLLRIKKAAYDFFNDRPMKIENGEFMLAGGRVGMEIAVNEEMKRSHAIIDITVLLAIFILCAITFSITGGFMLTIPLVLANGVAFAYMALNGIGLTINSLPVAAVGVGVGVDFAIYIYSRCIDEWPQRKDWRDTILTSVRTSGKAVVFTGLTMILPILTWYYISDLKFQAQMGMFLAIIMAMNVILALTLHPLMIYTLKPKFVQRRALDQAS